MFFAFGPSPFPNEFPRVGLVCFFSVEEPDVFFFGFVYVSLDDFARVS
jgi:hypothetical protein